MRLQNKTALITAAAAGIGRSTVALFLAEGAEVWAADINQQNLDQLKADFPRVKTVRLDVTDQNAINDFVANAGNIDVLFNCAGFVANGDLLNSREKDWDFSFELNVKSMYRLCNAICPGTVDTPSLQDRLNAFDDPQQARRDFENRQPIGRLAKPGEIASLALYLASDESSYTTGVAHVIDGGWSNI